MGTTEESTAKQEPGKQSQCNNCGRSGHITSACRSPKRANKSHSTQRRDGKKSHSSNSQPTKPPCPACNLQHKFGTNNNPFFGSRIYSFPTFKNLSIQDKTTVVENAKACVLCLDWRGTHGRDNSPSRE